MPTTGRILKTALADLYDARIKNAYSLGWDPTEQRYQDAYRVINVTTEDLRSTYVSGFGQWQVKEFGGNISYDSIYQGYDTTLTPVEYNLAFTIEQVTVEDEPHGLLGQNLARNLAAMGQYTVEVLAMSQFNTGFSATAVSPWMSGGDGQYFFDTDHPILSGGVYANKPATDVDFSVSALQAARTSLSKVQGARGEILGLEAELVLAPIESRWIVTEVLQSPNTPYTADRTPNLAREGVRAVFNANLTDTDAWFVRAKMAAMDNNGRPSGPGATTVALWRIKPEFDRDNAFQSGDRQYKGRMRLAFGRWDWRYWYGSSGG